MPTVETTSPIEVEVNVTTESPTLNLQIDGYLRSELFVVDIVYARIYSSGSQLPAFQWQFSATAAEIAYAAAHGKNVVGRRVTRSSGNEIPVYSECIFGGIGDDDPVTVSFKEISSAGITTFTATGDSKIASMAIVPFSGGGGGISSLLVTFSESGGTLTADKTFAEVTAAVADGAYVYAKDSVNRYYSLSLCDSAPNNGNVVFICAEDGEAMILWSDDSADSNTDYYATETWVQSQGYLTQHQSLADYQTKAITDAGGYYTTDTVDGALQEIGAELAGINTLIGSGVIT